MAMDLRVKRLNRLGKGAQRLKYQSISDRIQLVNVDIHRRMERIDDNRLAVDDMGSTYFAESLSSWAELNLTASFCEFHYELRQVSKGESLPLLLHNRGKMVSIMIDHMSRSDSQCREALVDLLSVLARDLRGEFMPEFSRVLLALIEILDPMQPVLLEAIFTSIATMFKFLLKQLVVSIQSLYTDAYFRLLTHSKLHIREFAAETFSFLLRKVHSDNRAECIATIIGCGSSDDTCRDAGLASLFFYTFKGIGRAFHSCMPQMLPLVLGACADQAPDSDQIVFQLLTRMCETTERQFSDSICETLFGHAQKSFSHPASRLQSIQSLTIWIAHRRGSRVTSSIMLATVIKYIISSSVGDDREEILRLISASLLYTDVDPAPLLSGAFQTLNASVSELVTFVESLVGSCNETVRHLVSYQIQRRSNQLTSIAEVMNLVSSANSTGTNPSDVCQIKLSSDHLSSLSMAIRDPNCATSTIRAIRYLSSHQLEDDLRQCASTILSYGSCTETLYEALRILEDINPFTILIVERLMSTPDDLMTLRCASLVPSDHLPSFELLANKLRTNLWSFSHAIRASSIGILASRASSYSDVASELLNLMENISNSDTTIADERDVGRLIGLVAAIGLRPDLPPFLQSMVVPFFIGVLRVKFRLFWPPVQQALASLLHIHAHATLFLEALENASAACSVIFSANRHTESSSECTDPQTMFSLIINALLLPSCNAINSQSFQLGKLISSFITEQYSAVVQEKRCRNRPLLVKDGERRLHQQTVLWMKVLSKIRKPFSLPCSDVIIDFISRMQTNPEYELQKLAIETALQYKDPALALHKDLLLGLCDENAIREQMTLFSLDRCAGNILDEHRPSLLPVIFRLLMPRLSATKAKLAGRRVAVLTFVGCVDNCELELFIRIALGETMISDPLSNRVSIQTRFIDTLKLLLNRLGDRLHSSSSALLSTLSHMIAHHGSALDLPVDNVVAEDEVAGGGIASRELLRRVFHVTCRFIDAFPSPFLLQDDDRDRILKVTQLWAKRMPQELTQARSGVLDLILLFAEHESLHSILVQRPILVEHTFAMLAARNVSSDVVQAVVGFAIQLIDSCILSAAQTHLLMCSLCTLLQGSLQAAQIPSLALGLLSRLTPLVTASASLPDCTTLLKLLIPFTRHASRSDLRSVVSGIVSLVPLVCSSDAVSAYSTIHRLLLTSEDTDVRSSICQMACLLTLSEAQLLTDLNSFTVIKLEASPDFELRSSAYSTLSTWPDDTRNSSSLLSHILFDIRNPDDSLRRHAEYCLCQWLTTTSSSSPSSCPILLQTLVFPQLRLNLSKVRNDKVRRSSVEALAVLLLSFPGEFADMSVLISAEDREVDILRNLIHIQAHRQRRAFARIRASSDHGLITPRCASMILRPLLLQFVYAASTLDSATSDEAIRTLGAVAGKQSWPQYRQTLTQLVRALKRHPTQSKSLIRATCSVIDGWSYGYEVEDVPKLPDKDDEPVDEEIVEETITDENIVSAHRRSAGRYLLQSVLPYLYEYLQEGNVIRVPVAMAIVKLLQRLPESVLKTRLPRLISLIMGKLCDKDQRERDSARSTLCEISVTLGSYYLPFIINEMRHFLKDGFRVHIMGFTLHSLLNKLVSANEAGVLDSSLTLVLPIVVGDLFVPTIDKPKETREAKRPQSLSTVEIIASNVTFNHHNLNEIVDAIKARLDEDPSVGNRETMRHAMFRLQAGLRKNSTVTLKGVFVCVYGLIQKNLPKPVEPQEEKVNVLLERKTTADEHVSVPKTPMRDLKLRQNKSKSSSSDVMLTFALHLFEQTLSDYLNSSRNRGNTININDANAENIVAEDYFSGDNKELESIRSLCDPFLATLHQCASQSCSPDVISISVKAFCALLQVPSGVPSLQLFAPQFVAIMIEGAQNSSSEHASICLRGLTALLRRCDAYEMTEAHLLILLELVKTRIEDVASASGGLALLKSILCRRLLSSGLYDLMERVVTLVVEVDDPVVKRHAHQSLIQYLLDYPLSPKRIEQHLRTFITNLSSYQHPHGRMACVRMLSLCVSKFPACTLDRYASLIFMPLVTRLVNEISRPCRDQVTALISLLLSKVSPAVLSELLSFVSMWWNSGNTQLQCAASELASLSYSFSSSELMSEWIGYAHSTLESASEKLNAAICSPDGIADASLGVESPTLINSLRLIDLSLPNEISISCLPTVLDLVLYPHNSVRLQINKMFAGGHVPTPIAPWADAFLAHFFSDCADERLLKASASNLRTLVSSLSALKGESEVVERVFHRISSRIRRSTVMHTIGICVQWLAEVVDSADVTILKKFAHVIIAPSSPIAKTPKHPFQNIAEALLNTLSHKIGLDLFIKVSTEAARFAAEKRDKRKTARAREAVIDPASAATRKQKRGVAKKRQREKAMTTRKEKRQGIPQRKHTSFAKKRKTIATVTL